MTSDFLFAKILNFPIGIDSDDLFHGWQHRLRRIWVGDTVDFTALLGSGVSSFKMIGIDPLIDGGDPMAFPLQLDFDTVTASFTMVALTADSATTTDSSIFLGLGSLALMGGIFLKRKGNA